jgi:hypothetical protein
MILELIPLIAGQADQKADITVANQPFTIRVLWNTRFEYFSLTISNRSGAPILSNIKMVSTYPLVQRFKLFTFTGDFYFLSKSNSGLRPTFDDLGNDYNLYYYDPETPPSYPIPIAPRS